MLARGAFGFTGEHHQRKQAFIKIGDLLIIFLAVLSVFLGVVFAEKIEPVFFGGIDRRQIGFTPGLVVTRRIVAFFERVEQQGRRFSGIQIRFQGVGETAQQTGGFQPDRLFERFIAAENVAQPAFRRHRARAGQRGAQITLGLVEAQGFFQRRVVEQFFQTVEFRIGERYGGWCHGVASCLSSRVGLTVEPVQLDPWHRLPARFPVFSDHIGENAAAYVKLGG